MNMSYARLRRFSERSGARVVLVNWVDRGLIPALDELKESIREKGIISE